MLLPSPLYLTDQTVRRQSVTAATGLCIYHVAYILQWTACELRRRQRLQPIQNSAARLICSEPAFSHAAPLLHLLYCLPADRRIKYKLCVLMFDVFQGTAPVYLTDLCSRCTDHRLRPSARGNFLVLRTRTRFADSSFTVAGGKRNPVPRG